MACAPPVHPAEQDIVVREAVESMRMLMATSSSAVVGARSASGPNSRTSHEFAVDSHAPTTLDPNMGDAAAGGSQSVRENGAKVDGNGAAAGDVAGGGGGGGGGGVGFDGGSERHQQREQRERLQQLVRELGVEREKSLSLVAKLQRLEMERRVHVEEVSARRCQGCGVGFWVVSLMCMWER